MSLSKYGPSPIKGYVYAPLAAQSFSSADHRLKTKPNDQEALTRTQSTSRPTNLSMMQLLMVFALVSVVINQLSAFVAQLMAGKSWDDIAQQVLRRSFFPFAVAPGREVEDVNFVLVDDVNL